MEKSLIVGDGLLGKTLLKAIPGSIGTSRRENSEHWFDLGFDPSLLPACSLAYLCAGTKGFKNCEGNHEVFRADVDGNIRVAKHLLSTGAFVVFISSDCVEWSDSATNNKSCATNRTANRRDRKAYNAYQRMYMAVRRAVLGGRACWMK